MKAWQIVLGIAGLAGLAYGADRAVVAARKRRRIKQYDTEQYDPMTGKKVKPGSAPPVQKINLADVADSVINGLGVMKSWYDPGFYHENDDDVERALLPVPKALFPELIKVYASKTSGRSLITDLNKLLDSDNLARVKYLWS